VRFALIRPAEIDANAHPHPRRTQPRRARTARRCLRRSARSGLRRARHWPMARPAAAADRTRGVRRCVGRPSRSSSRSGPARSRGRREPLTHQRQCDAVATTDLEQVLVRGDGHGLHDPPDPLAPAHRRIVPERIVPERNNSERINSERINSERINSERINSERINSERIDPELSVGRVPLRAGGGRDVVRTRALARHRMGSGARAPAQPRSGRSAAVAHRGAAPASTGGSAGRRRGGAGAREIREEVGDHAKLSLERCPGAGWSFAGRVGGERRAGPVGGLRAVRCREVGPGQSWPGVSRRRSWC
jgi:hypothetical protein